MRIVSWNINSVRLRIDTLKRVADELQPDFLCLQEIKAQDADFPTDGIVQAGFAHHHIRGMKGYNGVAILSNTPLADGGSRDWCGREDCRHVAADIGGGTALHNFYVPAGGDEPDPDVNEKFRHKLDFLDEMQAHAALRPAKKQRAILVGDLNVAPLEHDVWSHKQMLKVVSHTPIECDKLNAARNAGNWIDAMRVHTPEPEKLYTWWSYRAMDNWKTADRGRRLDHVWTSDALADRVSKIKISKDYRGAERPSDHVPVTATIET